MANHLADLPAGHADRSEHADLARASNVSKHLPCLWDCSLVERERRGREIQYRLVAGVAELLASTDAVLATVGARVRACPRYGARRP